MHDLRIIFMGTPEFAVPSLRALVDSKFNVVAVVTAPDKPQGRGQKLSISAVKEVALELGIPVLQPINLKAQEFADQLKSFNANLQIVVAFRMLPESVWAMPALGTFNLHASLLPQYRGAAPINWAIINGEKETGATTFFLQHEIDTGEILLQEKEPISDTDTAGSLYERLMHKGAGMVVRTTRAIAEGTTRPVPQPQTSSFLKAPKIFKETCKIDWNETSVKIRNLVRGLNPYPSAWTEINGKTFKIHAVTITTQDKRATPGTIDTDNKSYIAIATSDGWVNVDELQPEGKRKMTTAEFLKGNRLII
jgi:methionyl-tRNA formyltransferase